MPRADGVQRLVGPDENLAVRDCRRSHERFSHGVGREQFELRPRPNDEDIAVFARKIELSVAGYGRSAEAARESLLVDEFAI